MTKIPYLAGRDPFLLHDIFSVLAKVITSLIHGAMLVALAISSLDGSPAVISSCADNMWHA
jgi:hypothetical protein